MDTFPAQGIPAQQIPIQPPIAPSPTQQPPQKNANFRKVFNMSSWIIFFALLPVTVLIFLSQDSIPGDLFYPVKRSMENVILAAASVNPATRAAFRTDLTETRFKEAQGLIVSKSSASGLSTFIDDVQSTKQEVTNLKNDTQRIKAEEKFINKLEEYQIGLSTLEAKTEQTIIAYQFQEALTPVPNLPSATPAFTPTPTPTPVLSSFKSQPTSRLTPVPTLTLAPTIEPTVFPQPENVQVTQQKKIAQSLKEAKEQLDKIKKDLEKKRKEERKVEKHEERNESEKKDKEDKENREKIDSSDGHK